MQETFFHMIKIIVFLPGKLCIVILVSYICFINLILILLLFLEPVEHEYRFPVSVGGSNEEFLGISACLENREHLKYFRNVGCVVTNHNKDEKSKLTIKAWPTNLPGSAFSLPHDNTPGIFQVMTIFWPIFWVYHIDDKNRGSKNRYKGLFTPGQPAWLIQLALLALSEIETMSFVSHWDFRFLPGTRRCESVYLGVVVLRVCEVFRYFKGTVSR